MTQNNFTPLRQLRRDKRLTIMVIARLVGVNGATISRVERNEQKASPDLAERLVKALGPGITELEILYPERYTPHLRKARKTSQASSPIGRNVS